MQRNPVIRAYCRQVGKALDLPRAHRHRLLEGLERELEELFSSTTGLTLETLCIDVGSPEESAATLMECADEKFRTKYQMRRKLFARTAIIGLTIFIITLAAYFIHLTQYDVDHTEIRIIQSNTE